MVLGGKLSMTVKISERRENIANQNSDVPTYLKKNLAMKFACYCRLFHPPTHYHRFDAIQTLVSSKHQILLIESNRKRMQRDSR
jgi:hypothetical protein